MGITRPKYFSISIVQGRNRVRNNKPRLLRSFSLVRTPHVIAGMKRYMPANCSITVSIELQGSNVCICVSDEGVGIPESQIPRVLQPFEQVGGDSAVAEEGSGLGLALAKSLTELQGGRFELTSEVDVGTTVRVTFPRKSLPVEMAS